MLAHLPFIARNALRNRRRSILTVLSIAASLCLLGLLMAFYHVFFLDPPTEEQALRLWTRNRISLANPLPLSYRQQIQQVPGVQHVGVFQWFGGIYKDARDPKNMFARFAVDPQVLFDIYPEYVIAEDQKKAFQQERRACLVGEKLARRLGFQIGDRVQLVGDIFPVTLDLTIRGIYAAPRDNESLMFHFDYLNESVPRGRMNAVGTYVIRAVSKEAVPGVARAVDEMFRNSPQQTKTETEKAFELSFLAFLGDVKLFMFSICAAITFTILLVSGNTMAMSVRERVREVGVLKTLGFTPGGILGIILGEAVVIALVGGVLGLGLTLLITSVFRQMPSMFTDMSRIMLPTYMWGICLAVAALIGLASSLWPAWGAARKPIVEALRFTD